MNRVRWRIFLSLFLWNILILFPVATDSNSQDPFSSQPRIVVEGGNLIFKSAENRDVTLTSSGSGTVKVNNDDLTNALSLVNSFITGSDHTRSLSLSSIAQKIEDLQNQWNSMSSMVNQMEQLQYNFTSLTNRVNSILGSGQQAITNRYLRRVFRRVNSLETQVQQLTQLLTTDECSSNPCRNGGTCVDAYNGFICRCTSAWEGVTCESDVNECAVYAGTDLGCQNGATCYNSPGSFRCHCPANYFGLLCSARHDDCSSGSHQDLCGHGTCVNEQRVAPGQPKYKCICESGWKVSSSGPACTEDVDECAGNDVKCSTNPPVQCINLPGTFHCGPCPHGYTGNGRTCSDIDECQMNNGGCSTYPQVSCINTIGSRNCGPCPAGYQGNGFQCTFVGVCAVNRGGCHWLASCTENTAISVTYRECRCPPGYVGNGEGLTGCISTTGAGVTSCSNNPCRNGNCEVIGSSFHCTCFSGYAGTLCDVQMDACTSNPCQNGGTCTTIQNGFTCVCTQEFEGSICSDPKQGCGGHIFMNNGSLSYPQDRQTEYRHRENCVWTITVDEEKILNFSFTEFKLEMGPNCEFDFVEVRDGPSSFAHPIGRFCGDGPIQSFQSVHNVIHVTFQSDESVAGIGFTLQWNTSEPLCGGELEVATHGAVNSPGYPGKYPRNRDCYWLVRVEAGKRIQFHFATLQLEHHENCSFDFLKIYDGANERNTVLQTFCTTVTPLPLLTSGSNALLYFHSDYSIEDTGFHVTYAAVPGIPGCGGTMTDPSGTISTPNYPNVYNHLLRCEWLIRVHPGDRIRLTFNSFNLEQHRDCQFDSLSIYDGDSSNSGIIGRYCGASIPPSLVSNSNNLFIKLITDYSVASSGFQAIYSTVCGGTYTELVGSLNTPYFPDNYPSSVTCYYKISLPSGYLIQLNFPFFDIESGYNGCSYDFLEVRDGGTEQSDLLGHYCGDIPPDPVTSTYNQLWLKFTSDGSVENRGFFANYTNNYIGCGDVMTDSRGSIGTPSHQALYPPSIKCTWLLRAPPGYTVRLIFETFFLESHDQCNYDSVVVKDSNGAQIGKYCGNSIPPPLTSTDNVMQVIFSADESVSHEGFNASYSFLDTSHVCGGDYYVESGVIRTPGFPGNYPHGKVCVWVLHAANGHQILLNTTTFELESHENCNFDFLEIRNGGYATSPKIGKFCGQTIPNPIPSHSNTLRLEFQSDTSQAAKGFEIFYDSTVTGCGGILNAPRGSIISPNYPQPYGHNADCSWIIHVSEGSTVSVTLVDVDIEEHVSCDYDYLQIFDGDSDTAPSLTKVCNNQQLSSSIVSKSNVIFVKFQTDTFDNGRGFHLLYQTNCNTVLKTHRGAVESPNFPNTYPHNHNCTWTIAASLGNNISISFSHIFMESGPSCDADFVEVLEVFPNRTNNPLAKYCGTPSSMPAPIETSTNTALVRFVTDRSIAHRGFRLEWTVKGCGGILERAYGEITSPNFPNGYGPRVTCLWHIKYRPGKRVSLTISDLDVEEAIDCVYDFVRVYAGEDETSPRLLNECRNISQPITVSSHGNHMIILFHSDHTITGRGFRASYQQMNSECGGWYTARQSAIISRNYPLRYDANDDCEWTIEVAPLHIIILEFDAFDLPLSNNCTNGVVMVYDGLSAEDPILMQHCGGMPDNFVINSTSNTMTIRLKADGNNVGTGFHARYKTGCGARILADDGGVITSPNYPHLNTEHRTCSWIISASDPGEKVTFTLTHLSTYRQDCETFYLEIKDGDQPDSHLLQKICDNHVPPPITSQGNSLHVFVSFGFVFRATYGISSSYCGGDYTSESGILSSPDYPNSYPTDTECVWTVSASAGNKVLFSFLTFHMEQSDYCNMDYVEIREDGAAGTLIGRYCGDQIPNNITAAHRIWMKFRSDALGTAQGFTARFGLVHGSELNGTSGVIESPGYPLPFHSNSVFRWQITVPNDQYVSISFTLISIQKMQSDGQDCRAGIMIYDGPDDTAPQLGEFICGYVAPDPLQSHGNQVTIKFISRMIPSSWRLQWTAVSEISYEQPPPTVSDCWKEVHINSSEYSIITSPGYPKYYRRNMNCTWIIRTPSHDHIKLNFTDISIEGYSSVCWHDKINVYTSLDPGSWNLNYTACGRQRNLVLESVNNIVKLEFISDFSWYYRGFNLIAEAVCGSTLSGSSGVINSSNLIPYLRSQHINQYQCNWIIAVRSRRTISISFESFNIPKTSGTSCNVGYLMLLNGGHITSPMLGDGKFCGSSIPSVPESGSDHVYIRLQMNSFSSGSPRFVLRYTEVSIGCGGQVFLTGDESTQSIESPNYPNPPPHSMECGWTVMSPVRTRIRIDFDDEFHFSENCFEGEDVEYVQLYDGGTEQAPPKIRFCYSNRASSVLSTGNTFYIKYFTEARHPVSGFKATLQIAECGGIITTAHAEIQSPKYPQNYESGVDCEWMIQLEHGYFSYLLISDFETPPNSDCYQTDYLEIRDESKEGNILGTYCGSSPNSTTIELPGNTAFIKFKTNGSETRKGFHMYLYPEYKMRCGGQYSLSSGTITSPNYPAASASTHTCDWYINVPDMRRVTLKFMEFNLRKDELTGRCINGLKVFENGVWISVRNPTELCGNELPETIESSISSIHLKFRSSGLSAGEGFIISYSTENEALCGGPLLPPSGTFGVMDFNFTSRPVVECKWMTTSDWANQTIAFKFNTFYMPGNVSSYCRNGSVIFGRSSEYYNYQNMLCGDLSRRLPFITSPHKETVVLFDAFNIGSTTRINASYNINECGGVIDGTNATITSPGYPNSYPVNIDCNWLLKVPHGSEIMLKTLDLRLDGDCSSDYVQIFNGYDDHSPLIDKLCGTTIPTSITSTSNVLTIVFHSDQYGTAPGFKMMTGTIEEGCGGSIHHRKGLISSPNYPSRYDNNIECVWTIQYTPGFVVNITFVGRFDIEKHGTCDKDYLLIEDYDDGAWHEVSKECGIVVPSGRMSSSTKMRITFHSDMDIKGDGFQIQYSAGCGGNFTDSEGSIYSPNYPEKYDNNLHCKYLIGRPGQHVRLRFDRNDFSVETHGDCVYDYVAIYRGNSTSSERIGKYCGTEAPYRIDQVGQILMEFVSDFIYTGHGFVAHYETIECGGNYTALSGRFRNTFQGQPAQFTDCTWNIYGQENRVIALRFSHISMGGGSNCYYQYIEVREWNSTGELIVKFCGYRTNAIIKSKTNIISVRYHSDWYHAFGRFDVVYTNTFGVLQGCGGTITSSSGEFTSLDFDKDGKYEPDLDCAWTIIGSDDQMVNLTFPNFNLEEPENGTCFYDFVEVRDGIESGDPIIGRYCGSIPPSPIIASSNRITVIFHSDSENNYPGFKAAYTSVESPCGTLALIVTNETNSLSSPDYPSASAPNTFCRWKFYLNDTNLNGIDLTFKEINIPCTGNGFVEVRSSNSPWYDQAYRLCGPSIPHDIISDKVIWFTFKSGPASVGEKFQLDYRIAGCNRTYTKDNGAILSPGYPLYSHNCLSTVEAIEGKTISLYFASFSMYSSHECDIQSLTVYDGGNVSSSRVGKFCGYSRPDPIFSTGNKLTLKLEAGEYAYSYYRISYTTTDKGRGCGGHLTHARGAFSSPLYPEAYNQSAECSWFLSVPGHHTMSLYFWPFTLNSTTGCTTNYVEVYEGHSEVLSNRIIRLCGDDYPSGITSQSSQLLVKYVTNASNISPGFKAQFAMNYRNFDMEGQEIIQNSIPIAPAPGISTLDLS